MSEKTIAQRMFIKPGMILVVLNSPPGYLDTIGNLPEDVSIQTNLPLCADIIQLFITTKVDLEKYFPILKQALKDEGSLWISYPKISSKVKTDLNRDIIWQIGQKFGLKPVAMISIDSTWSGFRLKKRVNS